MKSALNPEASDSVEYVASETWMSVNEYRWWQPHPNAPEGRVLQQLWMTTDYHKRKWKAVPTKFGGDMAAD